MKLNVSKIPQHHFFEQLSDKLKKRYVDNCDEYFLEIPARYGEGEIWGINFQEYLTLYWFDLYLNADLNIDFQLKKPHPMRFLYCLEGSVKHQIKNSKTNYELQAMNGSITLTHKNNDNGFHFPKNLKVRAVIIEINRKALAEKINCEIKSLPYQLIKCLENYHHTSPFFYKDNNCLLVSEMLMEIVKNKNTDLAGRTFIEAKILELISQQIKQYQENEKVINASVTLRNADIELITKAKDIIESNLQNPPTIKELAQLVGLNQNKLQKGFKFLFNTTINNYLTEERLNTARLLLLEGELLVSEVAEKVGYTNKSHFAYLFKTKFGFLPKEFSKQSKIKIA